MDPQWIIPLLLSVVITGVGWWVANIWSMVRDQQKQITDLQVHLANHYVPRAESDRHLERIYDALEEIRKSLAGKG